MNASKNSRLMNSLLPLNSGPNTPPKYTMSSTAIVSIGFILLIVGIIVTIMYYYKVELDGVWNKILDLFNPPAPAPAPAPEPQDQPEPEQAMSQPVMNKIMPGTEVFNVSSNKYTYSDAEPLCKAFGAELATYDQVKDAWTKGADWCNYGWVKGQMAVYPTSDETYQKIQAGPEDQRQSCGRPGLNGGYFDNPEMRFGVTCVGNKPPQNKHDEDKAALGAPISPDAVAFDKKVSQFKSEADHIAILPFNNNKWTA